jgi:hypothetical protein
VQQLVQFSGLQAALRDLHDTVEVLRDHPSAVIPYVVTRDRLVCGHRTISALTCI